METIRQKFEALCGKLLVVGDAAQRMLIEQHNMRSDAIWELIKEGRASAFREAVEIARRAFYGASGSEKGSEYCYDIDIADAIEAAAKEGK